MLSALGFFSGGVNSVLSPQCFFAEVGINALYGCYCGTLMHCSLSSAPSHTGNFLIANVIPPALILIAIGFLAILSFRGVDGGLHGRTQLRNRVLTVSIVIVFFTQPAVVKVRSGRVSP